MAHLIVIPPFKPEKKKDYWIAVRHWPDRREEYTYGRFFGKEFQDKPMMFATEGQCATYCYHLNDLNRTAKVMVK